MAIYARTESVGTTAETVVAPTSLDNLIRIHNLDSTNGVWLAVKNGVTAVAEADECVFIPAGASYYARALANYSMIAFTAPVKVVLDGGQGRG